MPNYYNYLHVLFNVFFTLILDNTRHLYKGFEVIFEIPIHRKFLKIPSPNFKKPGKNKKINLIGFILN